jgi:hypothetical protein
MGERGSFDGVRRAAVILKWGCEKYRTSTPCLAGHARAHLGDPLEDSAAHAHRRALHSRLF